MRNKEKIEQITKELLQESCKDMEVKIKRAINSGAIDTDEWDENNNSFIIPKSILIAVLTSEADDYMPRQGSLFEKEMKSNIKNLKYFI